MTWIVRSHRPAVALAAALVASALLALPALAHGEPASEDLANLVSLQAQPVITADQASQAALAQFPGGAVQAVVLDDEDGVLAWEVRLTDASGAWHEVYVDASAGTVLAIEHEDAMSDDRDSTAMEHEDSPAGMDREMEQEADD